MQHNEHMKAFVAFRDRNAILVPYPDHSGYWMYYPKDYSN